MNWRWKPGMLTTTGWRIMESAPDVLRATREGDSCLDPGSYEPDVADPSTLRGLLDVVREAYAGAADTVEVRQIAPGSFAVVAVTFGSTGDPDTIQIGAGPSESAALLDVCSRILT